MEKNLSAHGLPPPLYWPNIDVEMRENNQMRCIRILSLVAILVALGQVARSVSAQNANPPGSYQQGCKDISVKKGNLYAKCQDDKGKSHSTKLSGYEQCSTDIVNKNGNLECAPAEGGAPSLPRGPYTESCKDIRVKGPTLYAVCKSIDGREALTSLRDANRCSQGVINLNGILNCEASDVLPPGSYLSTCKDVRMQGATLRASCNDGKDHWLTAELRDANKCAGDIVNQGGVLHCVVFTKMERR
jgi:hypothetical protein